MRTYYLHEFTRFSNFQLIGDSNRPISSIYTDSRLIYTNNQAVFICLQGKLDGHLFLDEAYSKGIRIFVLEKIKNPLADCTYLVVKNSLEFLQKWAKHHRKQFDLDLIGITGSNGKTTVKEWLNDCLWRDFSIVRSPKSYNSQLGVPISLLQINKEHTLGIFEAGISQPKEMQKLEELIQPTIGLLLNVQSSHSENFKNRKEQLHEKLRLFKSVNCLVYPGDDQEIKKEVISFFPKKELISWGFNEKNDLFIKKIGDSGQFTQFELFYTGSNYVLEIPFKDKASIENTLAVIGAMVALKLDLKQYLPLLKNLSHLEMRLEYIEGINQCTIINDAYTFDIQSLEIALNALNKETQQEKELILTDILQNRLENSTLYSKVAELVNSYELDKINLIGSKIAPFASLFKGDVTHYLHTDLFLQELNLSNYNQKTVLLKGARTFELENISSRLAKSSHDTTLEISFESMKHNIDLFKSLLSKETLLMCMVKAHCYGTGGAEIAKFLEELKVDYLGVAYATEGAEIRKKGVQLPIMVMNPEQSSFDTLLQYQLEPEIYSFRVLEKFQKALRKSGQTEKYAIHLKLDTGMHRLGFDEKEIEKLIERLNQLPQLKVKSIFSHMPDSDNLNDRSYSIKQIKKFNRLHQQLIKGLGYQSIKHLVNSAGIVNYPSAQFDMVRLGIGLYGYCDETTINAKLQTVATFKTVISQIKQLEKGESIGYGRSFITTKKTKIATLPVGYADGIRRQLSNQVGHVSIQGKKASIVGRVCMDMIMVDISDISCEEGDEVIIFGENPNIEEIANQLNTSPYEVLTAVSNRVKRVYYK